MTPADAAARRTARKAQESKAYGHKMKWQRAQVRRESWTDADFADEEGRLEDEIAELVANGAVQRCPTVWAAGSTGGGLLRD